MSENLDIDFTLACNYGGDPNRPCWGQVADRGEMARILTCIGHSRVPHGGVYYTREDLERAQKTGGKVYLSVTHFDRPQPSTTPEELNGIWETRPIPERVDDTDGFADAMRALTPSFIRPGPVPVMPRTLHVPEPEPLPEKVRLIVDGSTDEGLPEVWKDYL